MDSSSKFLNINFRPLVQLLRFNRTLVNVKHVPFAIPEPIRRSPTDLLKALGGTVKEDETSAHFGFIDDPITLPTSSKNRRHYLMSKELGRRTARKLVEEWPTLFMFDRDIPELKAFRPQKPLDPSLVEPTEENLQKMIVDRRVSDAIKLYQKISEKEVGISTATKLDLFRLVSYYNEENFPLTEFEEWHAIRYFYSNRENKATTWKEGGIAENLFDQLPKDDQLFSTLICALCKFPGKYSLCRTIELYKEMTSIGLTPFEDVFNSLISAKVPFDNSGFFDATYWLREMSRLGVRPSVKTFDAALSSLLLNNHTNFENADGQQQHGIQKAENFEVKTKERVFVLFDETRNDTTGTGSASDQQKQWETASAFVYEMRRLGLEPTLTTYTHILNLVPSRIILANILDEILARLEHKIKHSERIERSGENDANFFLNALSLARTLSNEAQIDRLMTIYRSEHNQIFFECADDEQRFYSYFIYFKMAVLPLDAFYIIYKFYVPRLLGVNLPLVVGILRVMKERKPEEFCWSLLKRIAEDVISSGIISSDRLALNLLSHLNDAKPRLFNLPDRESYMELCTKVIDVIEQLDRQKIERETAKNERETAMNKNKQAINVKE